MLYLIVPPIIIVITLVLLLWYLAKKANDPVVSEKVGEMEALQQATRFRGFKEWRLRVLEKFAQRSKTNLLRLHNAFNAWLQSIRASRKEVQAEKQRFEGNHHEERKNEVSVEAVFEEEIREPENGSASRASKPVTPVRREEGFGIPLMRRRKRQEEQEESRNIPKIVPARVEGEERPMVSTKVALPETGKRKGGIPEEDLIARIATNPKDFEAYEALGDYYMESGNIKDAKECYRQVLKLSPVQRMVKIKIRRLEKLLSQKGS